MKQEQRSEYYLIGAVVCLILGIASTYSLNQRVVSFRCPSPPVCHKPPPDPLCHKPPSDPSEKGCSFTLDEVIQFDVGNYLIKDNHVNALERVIDMLKKCPTARVKVDGYTDQTGTKCHNYFLSTSRAAKVTDFLVQQGISIERIESCGHGSDNPHNDRRVELRVIH